MPITRPSYIQIRDRLLADFEAEFGGGPYSPETVEYAEASAVAGVIHQAWGDLILAADSAIPDRAEADAMLRWAALFGITPAAALKHAGQVQYETSDTATIPNGSPMRLRDGTVYVATADASRTGAGPLVVNVEAQTAGGDGQAAPGADMTLNTPIVNITSTGTVLDPGLSGGADEQSNEIVLVRLIQRLSNPPGAGTAADYERWTLEVAGVTRVWVFPSHSGAGTVGIAFVRDGDGTNGDIIPDAGEVATVQAYLETKSPIVATVLTFAPVAVPINPNIILNPDTVALRAAATAKMEEAVKSYAAVGAVFPLSRLSEAISSTPGEESHVLVSPAVDVDPGATGLVILGTPTWS